MKKLIIEDADRLVRGIAEKYSLSGPRWHLLVAFDPDVDEAAAELVCGDAPYVGWDGLPCEEFVDPGNAYATDDYADRQRTWEESLPPVTRKRLNAWDGNLARLPADLRASYEAHCEAYEENALGWIRDNLLAEIGYDGETVAVEYRDKEQS